MDVDQCEKLKRWVANFLIPNLKENQRLYGCELSSSKDRIDMKKVEITKISLDEAFMISKCFIVNVLIEIKSDPNILDTKSGTDGNEFNFFVKVIFCN